MAQVLRFLPPLRETYMEFLDSLASAWASLDHCGLLWREAADRISLLFSCFLFFFF